MLTPLFVSFYIFFPFLFFWLAARLGFSLVSVGVVQFLLLSLFAFSFIGVWPLFFGLDEYRASLGATNQQRIAFITLCSAYTMLMVLLGASFCKSVFSKPENRSFCIDPRSLQNDLFWLVILLGISVYVLWLYSLKIEKIALLSAFDHSHSEVMVFRSEMGNNFSGKFHRYSYFIHDILNIVTFSFYAIWLRFNRKRFFVGFFLSFILASFTSLMAVEKGPFMWLLIGLFITHSIIKFGARYPLRHFFVFSSILLCVLIGMYMFFMGSDSIASALGSLISRRFAGSIQPVYQYLSFFPYEHDFIYGRSFPNPGSIFPFDPYFITIEVANWVFPELQEKGVVSTMPTVFWGEAYANFGYLGIAVIPFFIGCLVYLVQLLVLKFTTGPIGVGFFVWTILHYKNLAVSGFSEFIIDFRFVFVFVVCFFGLVLSSLVQGSSRTNCYD